MPDALPSSAGRHLFGTDPEAYATGRPGYPAALYDVLVERCGLGPGTATLEIGPGGGQATAELLARGAAPLVAVEPDAALAAYVARRFGAAVRVVPARFEQAELPAGAFDLAVAATASHWLEQDVALRRIADVLRSGGWWASWWNVHDDPRQPDALHDALQPLLGGLPHSRPGGAVDLDAFALDEPARVADLERTGAFTDIAVTRLRWSLALDPARARALFATFSPLLARPPDERERLLDGIADVVAQRFDGRLERAVVTPLYIARRR